MPDQTASPTPPATPGALPPAKPPPLTGGQKIAFAVALTAGIVLIVIGIFFVDDDSVPVFLHGAILGGGGALTALGFMQLFYRPDRGPRAR